MSQLSMSLITFKKKIEEAVILVPEMCAEEKLKAVQFWNVVSERLQEIVNNSAADINALAMRLEQEDQQQQQTVPQQSLSAQPEPQQTSPKQSVQTSVPMPTSCTDQLSNDKQELYLPIITHSSSHQNIVNDNSILSIDNSSSHITNNDFNSQIVANSEGTGDADELDEHLASVITSYHESSESSHPLPQESTQQLLIAFEPKTTISEPEPQDVFLQLSQRELNGSTSAATTSVIQELDQNLVTSQRRNVIQSTQRAIEAIEKNLQNCCNDFVANSSNRNQFIISDNTCDETIINLNTNNSIINTNNSINKNLVKVIETTDESQSENSANTNHILFTETSFDVSSSYSSSENFEHQTKQPKSSKFTIDENQTNNSNQTIKRIQKNKNKNKNKKIAIKKKSKTKCLDNSKSLENNNKSLFECDICRKILPNNSALVTHKWIHSKPYSCGECEARFSTKGNLLVHQRRHTGEKPFACDRCPASFSTKGNLKRHIKAHSGERPWKCSQCDSRFTEKKSLKVHMRRHTGEKPYQCSVCGKSFSQTGVLQTHMALHLDERKHLCELCGKAFRQRSQLRLHVLRHEGVKRWDCTDCEAKFLTKGDLERHHRVHTGERPFVCDLCGKTFTRQQSLNEHSNRHYGLKPYSCTVCSKTFAEMSACYKHIKVHKKQQTISNNNKSNDLSNDKTSVKQQTINTITSNRKLTTNEYKISSDLRNTRSHINVIQSTTSSTDKGLVFVTNRNGDQIDANVINVSIDDSIISCNSNTNTNDNNSIEFVDFNAVNLLANTSTKQKHFSN